MSSPDSLTSLDLWQSYAKPQNNLYTCKLHLNITPPLWFGTCVFYCTSVMCWHFCLKFVSLAYSAHCLSDWLKFRFDLIWTHLFSHRLTISFTLNIPCASVEWSSILCTVMLCFSSQVHIWATLSFSGKQEKYVSFQCFFFSYVMYSI